MVPVSSGRATSGRGRRRRACSWPERSRRFDDEQQRRAGASTAASGVATTFDSPRAEPARQRLVGERVARPSVVTPSTAGAERQQRDEVAGPPDERPARPGRRRVAAPGASRDARPSVEDDDGACRPGPASASRPMLASAWSSRGPPSAPTMTIPSAPERERGPDRELRVRLVLVAAAPARSGRPAASSAASAGLAERVAVADPQVDRDAERRRRGGRRRRPRRRGRSPSAQPGQAASSAARGRGVAVGEDQGVHRMLRGCYPVRC